MEVPRPFLNCNVEDIYIDGVSGSPICVASGGVASVFQGVYTVSKNGEKKEISVAIKVFRGMHTDHTMLAKYEKRLEREGKFLRAAAHPNIIQFFGFCKKGVITAFPSPGIVTLYCERRTIMEYLDAKKDTPSISGIQNRMKLIIGIARGLAHLHSLPFVGGDSSGHGGEAQGNVPILHNGSVMVHGDLKPSNVLILNTGSAAICDFGQSRILYEEGYTTTLSSSTRYAAPEIFETDLTSKATSPEADVYSFAMTALEVASGVEPFAGKHWMHALDTVREGKRPQKEAHADVPGLLWNLLVSAWGVDPTDRPTMKQIVDDLVDIEKNLYH